MERNSVCFSDHFPIKFSVLGHVRRKKMPKREFFNFKKANWDDLNSDLQTVEWDNVINENLEINSCWENFKTTLNKHVNKHIPKVKVKNEFQAPWFDSECYTACRNKERLRRKFKKSNKDSDGLKFSLARKNFQKLVSQKMREN